MIATHANSSVFVSCFGLSVYLVLVRLAEGLGCSLAFGGRTTPVKNRPLCLVCDRFYRSCPTGRGSQC